MNTTAPIIQVHTVLVSLRSSQLVELVRHDSTTERSEELVVDTRRAVAVEVVTEDSGSGPATAPLAPLRAELALGASAALALFLVLLMALLIVHSARRRAGLHDKLMPPDETPPPPGFRNISLCREVPVVYRYLQRCAYSSAVNTLGRRLEIKYKCRLENDTLHGGSPLSELCGRSEGVAAAKTGLPGLKEFLYPERDDGRPHIALTALYLPDREIRLTLFENTGYRLAYNGSYLK
ncbi:hypothetical protein AAG570_011543 [Ranatra chinensis]|uniref:Uncharacterized protein n=1 Tax=Ranatra chinensis TaxID=642074 RepID=A0ABD0YZ49_9HEMI